MFWSRDFKDANNEDGVPMRAGRVIVEAQDAVEAYKKIREIESEWKNNSYCVGSVKGPFNTKKEAEAC
jgi:hypothetical protein